MYKSYKIYKLYMMYKPYKIYPRGDLFADARVFDVSKVIACA